MIKNHILLLFGILNFFNGSFGLLHTEKFAEPSQFPFMINLRTFHSYFQSMCGGSIVNTKFGLTAAHCVSKKLFGPTRAVALMGIVDRFSEGTRRKIIKIIVHEDFETVGNLDYGLNDIALLQFEFPIEFSSLIQPITLPPSGNITYLGDSVTALGWGVTAPGSQVSNHLKYAEMRVISNDDCQAEYDRASTFKCNVTETMLCVASSEKNPQAGACSGDSGGPIVLTNTSTIVGIFSFSSMDTGSDCAIKPVLLDVFTRVSKYVDWIKTNVEETSANEVET
ncbi:trypsin-1-like [Culicoides brevitarsis]|uniref:trypsin-1-like n=1 Tax=Culicoides brevitarsis TaxID=469753 RepID=UPI00307C79B4